MVPTLRAGDVLVVTLDVTTARPGDLVVVRWPGRPLSVKRLMQIEPDQSWWVVRDSAQAGIDSFSEGAVPLDGRHGVALARMWPRPRRLRAHH